MSARGRLDLGDCIEVVGRLEGLAGSRGALVGRLRRLRGFLSGLPEGEARFPLLATAEAVNPDDPEPVAAFREFRRTVADFAAGHGIDLVLVVDGQKRADHAVRVWWMEGTDPTDRRLSDLSAAAAAAAGPDALLVRAFGRPERDGRTVVRTFFDIAPAEATGARRFVERLLARLDSDVRFGFEEIPTPRPGDADAEPARSRALADADLVVVLLSPEYLRWRTTEGRRPDDALRLAPGRVAPVCWADLAGDCQLGPYASRYVFSAPAEADQGPPAGGMRGLGRLSAGDLDHELAALHASLVDVFYPPPVEARHTLGNPLGAAFVEPMQELARMLARSDEPNPVTIRAVPARLDKRAGAGAALATPTVVERGTAPVGPTVEVVDHLVSWATAPGGRPYFVVFGEYGMGKTVATQTLTRRLLTAREADASVPLPIYFDLRVLGTEVRKGEATLDEILGDLIRRAWRTGRTTEIVTPEDVVNAVQDRRAVVIFDGLDEVLVHMSELQGQGFLRELLRILPPHLAGGDTAGGGGGKVVLTCRTHFFGTLRDQHTFFRGQDRDVPQELYEALHLLPFTETQVRAYLEARQGPAGIEKALELIRSVHDLSGLASRPYNLRLISEQLERLERRIAQGGTIDGAGLYDELVQSWMERDSGKHQLDRNHKVRLMEDLAALLWQRKARRIGVVELETWLRERLLNDEDLRTWVQLARPDPSVLAEDLRTATFIVRPDTDQFEFAHTSLLEYFLARYLHRTMTAGQPDAWQMPPVSIETVDFLIEIAAGAPDAGAFLHHLTACGDTYRPRISEQVVRYTLRAVEQGRPAPSLHGFELNGARLRGLRASPPPGTTIDMTGSDLSGADLREVQFRHVRLDHADLTGVCLDRAELHHCSLTNADLTQASLHGAIIRSTTLAAARMDGAVGEDSQWLWCDGEPATAFVAGGRVAPAPPQQQTDEPAPKVEVLTGLYVYVYSVAWSPDGTRVAVVDDLSVKIWHALSGIRQANLPHSTGHGGTVAWSPDGTLLASGGVGGVRLWQAADPEAAPVVLASDTDTVHSLSWSPDGRRIATGDDIGVRLWAVSDPGASPVVVTDDPGSQVGVAWSPDGTRIATGSDRGLRLWDVDDPTAGPLVLRAEADQLTSSRWAPQGSSTDALAWSPDGTRLAAISGAGVRTWSVADPEATPLVLDAPEATDAIAWSPDGRRLAAGGFGYLRLWEMGDPQATPKVLATVQGVYFTLAWSPDGRNLAAGSVGFWLLEADDFGTVWINPPALGSTVKLAWSPDGSRLAAGKAGHGVLMWETARPETARLVRQDHKLDWAELAWAPDGSWLAASAPGLVQIWEAAHPEATRVIPTAETTPPKATTPEAAFAALSWRQLPATWSPDRSRFATGGDDGLRLWDMDDPDASPVALGDRSVRLGIPVWSPDGILLATFAFALAREDRRLLLWTAADPEAAPLVLAENTENLQALAWSPDATRLAATAEDSHVRIWDVAHPEAQAILLTSEHPQHSPTWSPDGSRLATISDNRVLVWNTTADQPPMLLTDPPMLLTNGPNSITWSPDGTRLAACSRREGVRVWDVGHREAKLILNVDSSAEVVAWSPDGHVAASGLLEGVKVWPDSNDPQVDYTIYQFQDGAWCTLDTDGQLIHSHGETWRSLRWRHRDPVTGNSVLLPAEHFGPLPGSNPSTSEAPTNPTAPLPR